MRKSVKARCSLVDRCHHCRPTLTDKGKHSKADISQNPIMWHAILIASGMGKCWDKSPAIQSMLRHLFEWDTMSGARNYLNFMGCNVIVHLTRHQLTVSLWPVASGRITEIRGKSASWMVRHRSFHSTQYRIAQTQLSVSKMNCWHMVIKVKSLCPLFTVWKVIKFHTYM